MKKLIALLLALVMVIGLAACGGSATTETKAPAATEAPTQAEAPAETEAAGNTTDLPRDETLYFAGQQWGTVNSWNVIGTNQNNAMALAAGAGYRTTMFETLYMWNVMTGELIGLLADGDYTWNDNMTELSVNLKEAAHWSDGTPVTAADVVRTWEIGVEIGNGTGSSYGAFIDSIEATGDKSLVIHCKLDASGAPVNPLKVLDFLELAPIAQAAWIDKVVERCNGDATAILNDPGDDVVWSGPYTKYYSDDQKVVLIRDDNYWGQDASMWGKLPVPKYLAHVIYADNAAGEVALKAGEVDVCQQFIGNIQNLWLEDGLPISTFYDEAPYGVCLTMPTAWYNMNLPVIAENTALRKAIAMGIDKQGFVSALLDGHGVPGNGAFPDGFATFGGENVTTETYDPESAKEVLEAAGWTDSDGDGIREKDGVKLTIRWLTYPSRQELPLLAESAQATLKDIGIDVDINCTANRREFLADMTSWDIYASAMVTAPSGDPQYFFTSCCVPGMSYNFGAYENTDVNAMIDELATEFDTEKRGELAVKLQQTILDDNAYVFCSFLQMNMISKSTVTGYTAHACDYYQVTADLDING